MRRSLLALLFWCLGVLGTARAQVSPFLPLDDPRTAFLEHLITRGELPDPSPMLRPLRGSDVVPGLEVLAEESGRLNGLLAGSVLERLTSRGPGERVAAGNRRGRGRDGSSSAGARSAYGLAFRTGGQASSRGRRELLHPSGSGGGWPYAEASGHVRYGPLVVAARSVLDPRLGEDPDWLDSASAEVRTAEWRLPEIYASLQTTWGGRRSGAGRDKQGGGGGEGAAVGGGSLRASLGRWGQNWGPVGLSGLALSDEAYPRTALSLELTLGPFHLLAQGGELRGLQIGSGEGATSGAGSVRRFVAHRLGVKVSQSLHVAVWETGVVTMGQGESGASLLLDPFRPLLLGHVVGLPDERNILLGADLVWRTPGRLLLEIQGVLDDLGSSAPEDARPARWGGTLGLSGPMGSRLSWRSRATVASSLAFRTHTPEQNYTDGGIGIGRNFVDQAQFSLSLGVPVDARWILLPEVVLLRQGEGQITSPFPAGDDLAATPTLFLGVPSTTWRGGLGWSGQSGPFVLTGFGGLQHTRNSNHIRGRTRTTLEGRIQATIGFSLGGSDK